MLHLSRSCSLFTLGFRCVEPRLKRLRRTDACWALGHCPLHASLRSAKECALRAEDFGRKPHESEPKFPTTARGLD